MSENPQQEHPDVSRETSDAPDSVTMLNEILDRAAPQVPDPPEGRDEAPAQPEPPAEEKSSPPLPAKNKPSSAYIYMAVLFGAAFLMLLLAYFVQQRNNDAVQDNLELLTASRQELLEQIAALEEEKESLQGSVESLRDEVDRLNQENEGWKQHLAEARTQVAKEGTQARAISYLWYLSQFMEARDYPMAAIAIYFSGNGYSSSYETNPAQLEQYLAYRQELIDRGYLAEVPSVLDSQPSPSLIFTQRRDPSQSADMAALSILWCAMDSHFLQENGHAASQYLCLYPLGDPAAGYQERVERLASEFTLGQFQLLKDELVENKWLVIAEDGTMGEGFGPTGFKTDILYNLPFELPIDATQIPLY